MNQHFDGIGGKVLSERIDRIFDGRLWDHPPGASHQELQPVHLAATELHRDAVDGHFAVAGIERHIAGRERDAKRLTRPAQ